MSVEQEEEKKKVRSVKQEEDKKNRCSNNDHCTGSSRDTAGFLILDT